MATWLVPVEGAISTGAMHGQLCAKEHPQGNTSRTALVWEILSKRTPNREMCRQLIKGRERGKKDALHDAIERESHIARKLKLTVV